jgi:1-acyl-sn-glycerol-3-phosphate acyltransferase
VPRPNDPRNPGASLIYRFAAWVAFAVIRLQRWRFDIRGLDHLPERGGAVLAVNHTSFWDFFTVGRAPYLGWGRPVRILAKESLFRAPVFGWLMRRAEHIPVHRGAGATALRSAIDAAERGELVLVLPEQTISPSFELLPFKTGAARMAAGAGVPLIPCVSWGSHRFHTSGRRPRWSWRLPVVIAYGEPLHPTEDDDPAEVVAELRERMRGMLDEVQRSYPAGAPAGAWWVPARLGGSAPTQEEAERHVERLAKGWKQAARETVEHARERVEEGLEHAVERVQETAEHAAERAQETVDHARERMHDGLELAKDRLHETAEHTRELLQADAQHDPDPSPEPPRGDDRDDGVPAAAG